MSQVRSTKLSFLNHLQEVHYAKNEIEPSQIAPFVARFREFNAMPFGMLPAFYVIDYTSRDYVMMSEGSKYQGLYHPRDFMDGGLNLLMHIYHKDDFKVYNEKIFSANKQFLEKTPYEAHQDYIFNYTFRVRNGRNQLIHIYQRGGYITSPVTKQPLYSIGMVMNISGLYDEHRMFHSIQKTAAEGMLQGGEVVQQNYFFPNEEDALLSERERDVVGFMAQGLSIKQISTKLGITENTVANHRKNMFAKTNTKNMAELIAFVIRNNII